MKRILSLLFVVLLASLVIGCGSMPRDLTNTINEACAFYQESKPAITAYVQWAQDHWDDEITLPDGRVVALIPDDQKALLLEIYAYLPKLDAAGQTICAVAYPSDLVKPGHVDWDRVLSVTLKVAGAAAKLHAQGMI